jgi:putative transposase
MIYPLVRDLATEGARIRVPVRVSCRVLGFSPQAYYAWLREPCCQRDWDDAQLINAALDIHRDDPEFGYRFVADELAAGGVVASEHRVHRLCRLAGISSVHAPKRGGTRRPGPPVHDDLVERRFTAAVPNELWLTDITEHPTAEGTLYLCAVKDVYSGRIVGYSMDARMKASLAVAALRGAVARRGTVDGCVVHSDRGSQFRSRAFVHALRQAGLVGSMGRVAAAADNAAMESFYALLQKNVLDRQRWQTRDELRLAIISWIERVYHRRRRQRRLGRLTPIEFETINHVAHAI